jgi:RNA polymerase sigma factor for flagellar operon FliA
MSQLDLFSHQSINSDAAPKSERAKSTIERRRDVATERAPYALSAKAHIDVNLEPLTEKEEIAQSKRVLWAKFFENPCDGTRNDLSLAYMPLVKMIADGLKDKFPGHVDVNDLVSTGYIGLLDAISKFDPTRDIKFESYSVMRIRGEILDSIRHQDIVPRQVRILQNNHKRATKFLAKTLHREPCEEEVISYMQITPKQYETLIQSFTTGRIVSIDAGSEDKDGKSAPHVDKMPTPNEKSPSYNMQRLEVLELILRGLSKKEQAVLVGYYMEGRTMKQIGESLSLSESRVCQIHMEVLKAKRKKLGDYEDCNPD